MSLLKCLFTFLCCLSSLVIILAQDNRYRLPTNIIPTKYTIDLEFLGVVFSSISNSFNGNVKIEFTLKTNATDLKLHASKSHIDISKIILEGNEVKDFTVDNVTDILTIPLVGRNLVKDGNYTVTIQYSAVLSTTSNEGVFKSSYTNKNGDERYLIATQFQTVFARRAFPCFDEPAFKATFDFSITYYSAASFGLGVLFNTESIKKEDLQEDTSKVTFKTTPKMSTYLIAFVISDFSSTKGLSTTNGINYTVWSRADLASSRNYAATVGPKILNALDKYTGRNYSEEISKIDHVALPELAAGSMENWGLITYRETLLLWDQNDTADTAKKSIATGISHKSAHQWFGDLITCDWWSEAYLNEGFATYLEYFLTHEIEPTWQLDKQFIVEALQPTLDVDSLKQSQALKSSASTPAEIREKFSRITYNKGASILRMLSQVMGEEDFRKAIKAYVDTSELQEATITSSKLWEIFQTKLDRQYSAIPESITLNDIMKNWVEKPGYPLITASLNGKRLTISQERFLIAGSDNESKWFVPITYVESEGEINFQTAITAAWLTPTNPKVTLNLEYHNNWVILNTFQTGFYRVNYDLTIWKNLAAALRKENFDGIVEENRAQIVDDALNIAKANKLNYSDVFEVVEFLKNDTSYFSWVPAFNNFQYMLLRAPSGSQLKSKMEQHVLSLMESIYKTVPLNETTDDQIYLLTQSLVNTWACLLREESCVREARRIFSETVRSGMKPPVNIRSVIYCNGLRYSDKSSDYDVLWKLYGSTINSNDKLIILRSLGCSSDAERLNELLRETLKNSSQIQPQDAATAFSAVYSASDKGVDIALDFLIANFKAILTKYSSRTAPRTIIIGIAARLTTKEQSDKLRKLFDQDAELQEDLKPIAQEASELVAANLNWNNIHERDLKKYYNLSDNDNEKNSGSEIGINLTVTVGLVLILIISKFQI